MFILNIQLYCFAHSFFKTITTHPITVRRVIFFFQRSDPVLLCGCKDANILYKIWLMDLLNLSYLFKSCIIVYRHSDDLRIWSIIRLIHPGGCRKRLKREEQLEATPCFTCGNLLGPSNRTDYNHTVCHSAPKTGAIRKPFSYDIQTPLRSRTLPIVRCPRL